MPHSTGTSNVTVNSDHQRDTSSAPRLLVELLEGTGININGNGPCDIQVHDAETYRRVLTRGSLGFGEAYMDGLWNCKRLDAMFTALQRAGIGERIRTQPRLRLLFSAIASEAGNWLINRQSPRRAFRIGEQHYDLGNDLFEAMLDPTLSYSCAYWAHAEDLDQAQRDKFDMICRKLELRPGERLLDIGCGWGGLARYAAQHYGAEVFGITVSREQLALARQRCAGLPVTLELMDYRDLHGRYDKIVSVGMFEHVGPKNYTAFFDTVRRLLDREGLMLLHTIGDTTTNHDIDPWINKYIFPAGKLPSAQQIAAALEPDLVIRDWHEFGLDYDRTLMAWWTNFNRAWPGLRAKYGQRFYRMWKYYLHSCAAGFRSGQTQLWQVVLAWRGARVDYHSIRP
jgi:cyclopropane-fatty-acyl-phospholipid synthase